MNAVSRYLDEMLPYMLCALPLILAARALRVYGLRRRGIFSTPEHEAGLTLFLMFLVGLASLTVLPEFDSETAQFTLGFGLGSINLVPFRVFPQTWRSVFVLGDIDYFIINFLGNIGMFLPIGLCVPLLWRRAGFGKTVLAGFLGSLFIELCQIPQNRGTDVDDLWLNTLGAAAGYGLFLLLRRRAPAFTERCKVRRPDDAA